MKLFKSKKNKIEELIFSGFHSDQQRLEECRKKINEIIKLIGGNDEDRRY